MPFWSRIKTVLQLRYGVLIMCLTLFVLISFSLQKETLQSIRGMLSKPCSLRRVTGSLERVNWTYDKIKLDMEHGSTISRKLRLPLHLQNIQSATDEMIAYSKKLVKSVQWIMGVTDAARLAAVTFCIFARRSPTCICKQAPSQPLPPTLFTQGINISSGLFSSIYDTWYQWLVLGPNFISTMYRPRASASSIVSWLQGLLQQTSSTNRTAGMLLTMYTQVAKHMSLVKLFWTYLRGGIRLLLPNNF